MMMGAQDQASAWRIRRATRSRRYIQALTPWRAGLVVAAGDFVQSFGLAWEAASGGITAAGNAPNNAGGAAFVGSDGIQWNHVPLLLTPAPTI
jgi:hypothetical protein